MSNKKGSDTLNIPTYHINTPITPIININIKYKD